MVFTTDGFFEVAIESWPEWDLNPQYQGFPQVLRTWGGAPQNLMGGA